MERRKDGSNTEKTIHFYFSLLLSEEDACMTLLRLYNFEKKSSDFILTELCKQQGISFPQAFLEKLTDLQISS